MAQHSNIPKTPIGFAFYTMQPFKFLVSLSLIWVTIAELLGIAIPFVLKIVVDAATAEDTNYDFVVLVVLLIPLLFFLESVFWRLSGFTGMRWIAGMEARGTTELYKYISLHSHSYFSNRFAGSISNKVSNAANGAATLADQMLWRHIPSLIGFIGSGILIYSAHPMAGYIFGLMILVLVPLNIYLAKYRKPFVVSYSESKTKLKGYTVDLLTNVAAMRQYTRRNHELEQVQQHADTVKRGDLKQWSISEWILVLNNIIICAAIGAMIFILAINWREGSVSTGDFVLVVTLVYSMVGTLVFIGNSINMFVRIYGEVEEGLDQTLAPIDVSERVDAVKLKISQASIAWKDASFDYEGVSVFRDFNLDIPAGQRVGLVGHSGAGKTTFVSLLLRQHDLGAGAIEIDGQNIAEVTQDSLRENIAVVPQEPLLFHRSIRENIAYGNPEASEEEIMAAAKQAQAHDFIVALPEGYDTLVGERGVKLSGGQKQRVAIARAMLKDAPILVLDEATSALDSESEVAIQKALETLMEGKTVIAVAHRLSTLRKMDRIIVLEDGKIIEDGTHEELSQAGDTYQKLWEHQAGGFLLDDD